MKLILLSFTLLSFNLWSGELSYDECKELVLTDLNAYLQNFEDIENNPNSSRDEVAGVLACSKKIGLSYGRLKARESLKGVDLKGFCADAFIHELNQRADGGGDMGGALCASEVESLIKVYLTEGGDMGGAL